MTKNEILERMTQMAEDARELTKNKEPIKELVVNNVSSTITSLMDLIGICEDNLKKNKDRDKVTHLKKMLRLTKKAKLKFDEMEELISEVNI